MTKFFHLDACWLIALGNLHHEDHAEAHTSVRRWISDETVFGTSSIAWSEFLRGKKEYQNAPNIQRVKSILHLGVIGFLDKHAEKDAEIFNGIGRPKSSKSKNDRMIAALAIIEGAELVTFNVSDFRIFVPFGLRIAGLLPVGLNFHESENNQSKTETGDSWKKRA